MKKYRIIAGASAAVLALGLMTACGSKQENTVEEEPVLQENALEAVDPETQPEEEIIVEFPLEENAAEQESPAEDPEAEQPSESQTVLVAELAEVAEDGSMTILPYAQIGEGADMVMEDTANVDFSAFEAGEELEALLLAETVVLQLALDGELTDADESALVAGSMLVITTDEAGVQTIVIHQPAEEAAA